MIIDNLKVLSKESYQGVEVVSIDSLCIPIVPLDIYFLNLKGLVPLNYKIVSQRLNTFFLGLISNCGGRCK
jgi:hypothetical protein